MRYSKMLAWAVVAAGILVTGAQAKAEDGFRDGRDSYQDHRDFRGGYDRVDALRNHIATDRLRLNEDIRFGRYCVFPGCVRRRRRCGGEAGGF